MCGLYLVLPVIGIQLLLGDIERLTINSYYRVLFNPDIWSAWTRAKRIALTLLGCIEYLTLHYFLILTHGGL